MTKLEQERKLKKKIKDLDERIEAIGQESESKAAKWVQEEAKGRRLQNEQEISTKLSTLEEKTKFKFADYKRSLAQIMDESCRSQEFPLGWRYHIAVTEKGLVMILLSPDRRRFVRAFSPVNIPKYDFVAMEKIIESAWVAINRQPSSGIII